MKNSGYKNFDFKYNLINKNNSRRNRQRNIIWFKPPFNQNHLANQLHKIFNRNTVKVSYSCRPNVGSIIKSHNKKLANAQNSHTNDCTCSKKEECPLEGICRSEDIICKCVVTGTGHPRKVYVGTAEGDFKQRYYNHKKSFKNRKYPNETSLSK